MIFRTKIQLPILSQTVLVRDLSLKNDTKKELHIKMKLFFI